MSLRDPKIRRTAAVAIASRVVASRAASTLGPNMKDGDEARSSSGGARTVADGISVGPQPTSGKKTRIPPRLRSHSSLAAASAVPSSPEGPPPPHVHPTGAGLDSFRAMQERKGCRTPFDANGPSEGLRRPAIGMEELRDLASQKTTPLSLANMYRYARGDDHAQRLRNARFLHRELPIRIAQRAVDLLTLPHGLNKTRPIRGIAETYLSYLEKFKRMPCPTNAKEEAKFTMMLEGLVQDRTAIPMAIARGVSSLRDIRREELDVRRLQEIEEALYRFFTARVGLRFLTEHHILSSPERKEAIRKEQKMMWLQKGLAARGGGDVNELEICDSKGTGGSGRFLGCIQKDCDPVREVRAVADQVVRKTRDCYGVSPRIEIVDCTEGTNAKKDFTYVPHHLQYMLAELLKNSCRATVRRYLDGDVTQEDHASRRCDDDDETTEDGQSDSDSDEESNLPPVRVVVVKGAEDLSIKIADRGGGVPRSAMKKIWTFAHSTLGSGPAFDVKEATSDFGTDEFTGGRIRGFGLPLARTYARYFGGELTLKSMEGYGVDAYLYLPMLGVACENLPQRVNASPGNRDSHPVEDGRIGNPKFAAYGGGSGATRSGTNGQTFAPQQPGLDDFWAEKNKASSSSVMKMLAQKAL